MKNIKLVALPDTWFKEGTEVLHYDENRRISLQEWEDWQKSGIVLCRGIRICESNTELHKIGEEYEDGECCQIDEFNAEIIEE